MSYKVARSLLMKKEHKFSLQYLQKMFKYYKRFYYDK